MKSVSPWLVWLVLFLPLTGWAHLETHDFSNEQAMLSAGWQSQNSVTAGQMYGYSATSNTTGLLPVGEIGGRLARGGQVSFYADTSIGGPHDRSKAFAASGRLNVTIISRSPPFDGSVFVGHFDKSLVDQETHNQFDGHIGFNLTENGQSSSSLVVRAFISFPNEIFVAGNPLYISQLPNSRRQWSYQWDPTGGAAGVGRLTVTIDGPGGGTSTVELNSTHANMNFSLDAFGVSCPKMTRADGDRHIYAYFDDLTYSALGGTEVPDMPAHYYAALLVVLGIVVASRMARRVRS